MIIKNIGEFVKLLSYVINHISINKIDL